MTRREFLHAASVGVAVDGAVPALAETQPASSVLLNTQMPPLPSLGTHWPEVFEKLSGRCEPRNVLRGRPRAHPQADGGRDHRFAQPHVVFGALRVC
ncbi:MAG TPA: hypothetical protein VLM89_16175, partial [Phycisphaerae bacterium]|nr:hypothetical protein [Phycisphaerae bacterium]